MKRIAIVVSAVLIAVSAYAVDPPVWWSGSNTRIIQENGEENNYAPANLGQLKHVAKQAKAHLDATFAGGGGGAGSAVNALVDSFEPRAGQSYSQAEIDQFLKENYAPINLGQLKAVAKPFYDRLLAAGYDTKANLIARGYPANWAYDYPWNPSTPTSENYAPANIGQLKLVFSFDASGLDSDTDSLPDAWEYANFGDLNQEPDGDFDGDRIPNIFEYAKGTDPSDRQSMPSIDFIVDRDSPASGNVVNSIDAAVSQVSEDYSIISIHKGLYAGTGNADLAISGTHPILILGELGIRPTVIEGSGWQQIWRISGKLIIDGLNFRRGNANEGGAIRVLGGEHIFINCIFSDNVGTQSGAAIFQADGVTKLIHSTFVKNTGEQQAAAVHVEAGEVSMVNSILWDAECASEISATSGASVSVTNSIVRGGYSGTGNMNVDPQVTKHGYLVGGSVAIDAASNLRSPLVDIHGETRPVGSSSDIGADEWLDSDDDTLPDWWEHYAFDGGLYAHGSDDPDGDGLTNFDEFVRGSDPNVFDFWRDFIQVVTLPAEKARSGDVVGPFVVRARGISGDVLSGTAIEFSMDTGSGKLSANSQGTGASSSMQVLTGTNGEANVWIVQPSHPGETQRVRASAFGQSLYSSVFTLARGVADGVVAHYEFEDFSGTTARDWSGNGYTADVRNGATFTKGWAGGGGIRVYGGNEYVELPSIDVLNQLNLASYTISIRYRPEALPAGSGSENSAYHGLVTRYFPNSGLYVEPGAKVGVDYCYSDVTETNAESPAAVAEVAKTSQICVVVDRVSLEMRLYVDGELVTTSALDPGKEPFNYGTGRWRIGIADAGASSWRWCANGVIDDVQLYNRPLSASEVRRIHVGGEDSDNDSLPDWWEYSAFGDLDQLANQDPDGDGLSNLQEYQQGTNPQEFYESGPVVLDIVEGDQQSGPADQMLPVPLKIQVTGTLGVAVDNAPILFSITGSNGQIATSGSGTWASSQQVRTGTGGYASIYLTPSGTIGAVNQVEARTVTSGDPVVVVFSAVVESGNYERPAIKFTDGYRLAKVPADQAASFLVSVTDPDNRATKVELYASGTMVSSSTLAPFTTSWTPTVSSVGRVTMVARVFEGQGQNANVTSSDAKIVEVTGTVSPNTAYSPASGGAYRSFPPTSDTVASVPFLQPAVFAGKIRTASAGTVELNINESLVVGRFKAGESSYVLQVLSGTQEGSEYRITESGSRTLSVEGLSSGSLPEADARFAIRPIWSASAAIPAGSFSPADEQEAPEIKIPDLTGDGIDRPYARTISWAAGAWVEGQGSPLLPANTWVMVRNKTASTVSWYPIGDVAQASIRLPVGKELSGAHDTPVAIPRPGLISPAAAGLMSGGVLQESSTQVEPENILLGFSSASGEIGRSPDVRYYRYLGRLYELGDESSGDLSEAPILDGTSGWLIRRTGVTETLFNHAAHATP